MAAISKRHQQRTGWAIIAVATAISIALGVLGVDPDAIINAFTDSR